jgi:hypothetical protein
MSYYSVTRNTELSTLKFIEDNIDNDWSNVNVIKSWSQRDKVDNPVICVSLSDTTYDRKELGNTQFRDTYIFNIEVFATSEAMRIDLSHYVINLLNPGWTYYTIEKGSGTSRSLTYTSAGRCRIDSIYSNVKVDLGAMGDVKDKYRQDMTIAVTVGVA